MSFKVCMSFKVGDRVQHESFGLGTVIGFYLRKDDWPCIEYDKGQHHNGNGDIYPKPKHTPSNRCYFTEPSGLELISHKEETVSKYKVGDVVVIDHRDAGNSYGMDGDWNKPNGDAGKVGTITRVNLSGDRPYRVGSPQYPYLGLFSASELRLVNQSKENKPMGRRTFKLVKAMPGIKVGTLFQEECEDGTQPYSPMDGQPSEVNISFRDRSLVEDSKFFEEVWKVEPQFMTRAELDRFEAFKKQKVAKVAKTKKTAKKGYKKLTAAQKSKTLVAARKGYSKNGKRLGRPPKAGK